MPHADAALFSLGMSRPDGYRQVEQQLQGLFEGQRIWISNLANASSLLWALFHALPSPLSSVNWAGFYVRSDLFPGPRGDHRQSRSLMLAPFAGLPACQIISLTSKSPGVCAAAFLSGETQLVADVEKRAGHIACDAKTKSEIVVPIRHGGLLKGEVVGVLDIDCEEVGGFHELDQQALEQIAALIGRSCDW